MTSFGADGQAAQAPLTPVDRCDVTFVQARVQNYQWSSTNDRLTETYAKVWLKA